MAVPGGFGVTISSNVPNAYGNNPLTSQGFDQTYTAWNGLLGTNSSACKIFLNVSEYPQSIATMSSGSGHPVQQKFQSAVDQGLNIYLCYQPGGQNDAGTDTYTYNATTNPNPFINQSATQRSNLLTSIANLAAACVSAGTGAKIAGVIFFQEINDASHHSFPGTGSVTGGGDGGYVGAVNFYGNTTNGVKSLTGTGFTTGTCRLGFASGSGTPSANATFYNPGSAQTVPYDFGEADFYGSAWKSNVKLDAATTGAATICNTLGIPFGILEMGTNAAGASLANSDVISYIQYCQQIMVNQLAAGHNTLDCAWFNGQYVTPLNSSTVASGSTVTGNAPAAGTSQTLVLSAAYTAAQVPTYGFIQIRTEIMQVTAGSGTTSLTVTRGMQGTTPIATIAIGDAVSTGQAPNLITVAGDFRIPYLKTMIAAITGAASSPFTFSQDSGVVLGSAGTLNAWFNQANGITSQTGSLLIARITTSTGSATNTVTAPSGWTLVSDVASGTGTAVGRVQIWSYINNPGGLYGNVAAAPTGLAGTPSQTGGSLTAATYYYKVTGTGAFGETTGSNEVSAGITSSAGSVALTWGALNSATTGIKVYRGTTAGGENTLVATLGAVTSYTDTGGGSAATPPAAPSSVAAFSYTASGATVKARLSEHTTPPGTTQILDQVAAGVSGTTNTISTTPVTCPAANNRSGGLAVSMFGANLSGTVANSWTLPSGWTSDGSVANVAASYAAYYQLGITTGPTSVTGAMTITSGTMTGWAGALATFYAIATPVEITTTSLPNGAGGVAYTAFTVASIGGQQPYTYTATGLPSGMSISSAGVISGTPSVPGTYSVAITVTDANSATDVQGVALTITGNPVVTTPNPMPGGTVGTAYPSASGTLTATGGVAPYSWVLTGGSGPLPAGLSLSSAGVISGTPTTAATYPFSVSVTDSTTPTALTAQAALSITVSPAALAITTSSLPNGATGNAYSSTLAASGGTGSYTWAVTGGPQLPPGLSLNAATGVISGTPSAGGTYTFTITVTDTASSTASANFTVIITTTLGIVTPSPLSNGVVGVPYSLQFSGSGGTAPYSWSQTAGTLPPGLSFSSAGVLSGTPTTAGSYSFTIKVTDSVSGTSSTVFSQNAVLSVIPGPGGTYDSLIIADQIELLGGPGGVASTNPACTGAIFKLQPGYDLGAPQPTTDIVGTLILDGERPFGYRAADRTISLPLMIDCSAQGTGAAAFATLASAFEVLMQAVNQQSFTLTWTRKGGQSLVLECFRAQPTVVTWGGADQWLINPVAALTLTFQALPYGRSDTPVHIQVASPLPGQAAPAAPVTLDTFATVTGSNWVQSTMCVIGPKSAQWNPCLAPLSDCTGKGSAPGAKYTATVTSSNLTGLTALSVWAGFGSTDYDSWHKGPAVFAFTLSDATGNVLSFSRTLTVHASDESNEPRWQLVTAIIPQVASGFDYMHVTGYSITVTNRGDNSLRYTDLYLDALTANPPSLQKRAALVRGAMYQLLGVQGTARSACSAQFQLPPGSAPQQVVLLPGPVGTPQAWVAPIGVTSVKAECTGAGGGSNAGGGGGGEYSAEATIAVTPLKAYTYTLGAGGTGTTGGGGVQATAGSSTVFTGDSGGTSAGVVTAHSGGAGLINGTGGTGGTGSTNTTHFNGGNGATVTPGAIGGGGGGAAGSGGAGGNASGSTAGAGGTGSTPGGAGGAGASTDRDGYLGGLPGGGGGGVQDVTNKDNQGGNGQPGQIQLTYTPAVGQFSTLIAHRPGVTAPPELTPLVSFGLTDVPNGLTEYPLPALYPNVYPRFRGTYSVVVTANAWSSPGSSRKITVTVKQYEFQGGPSYSTSVSRTFTPSTDTFLPQGATLAQVPIVVLGELTLPLKDIAPDNTSGLFTITITDNNTADTFLDCLFLDTLGQSVLIGIPSAAAYTNFYADQPDPVTDLGRIMGSNFDRASAISVMDNALISGGPLYLEPGDNSLLVYAIEGAPALSVVYYPRYHLDRTT